MEHARSPTTHLRQSLYRYVDCSSADDGDYGFEYFLPLDTPLKFAIVSPKEPDCTLGAIRRALRIIVCAEMLGDSVAVSMLFGITFKKMCKHGMAASNLIGVTYEK